MIGLFLDDRTAGLIEAARFAIADDALVEVRWAFDSLAEAGEFCRSLVLDARRSSAGEVADAMYREIGFEVIDGRPHLRWALRRIVCDAI